jgi:hypothetical protein
LADCQASGLSPDWSLSIAYNAALQLATIPLAASGYRASRDSHHHRTIQSLQFTISAEPELIQKLDAFRKKRNMGGYERAGATSHTEAEEMQRLAIELRARVQQWLRQKHPEWL